MEAMPSWYLREERVILSLFMMRLAFLFLLCKFPRLIRDHQFLSEILQNSQTSLAIQGQERLTSIF